MSWVLLDDNFPAHPKTMKAGPMAAYLFVCGLCYCRRYHTGGFIPANALPALGVTTNPRKMVDALVAAGLWERAEGGFHVHDYQEQYDDEGAKAHKAEVSQKRREAGRKGGLANRRPKQTGSNQENNDEANASTFAEAHKDRVGKDGFGFEVKEERRGGEAPFDVWFDDLKREYPTQALSQGHLTMTAFLDVFACDDRPAAEVFAEMRANLATQKRGEQWSVKRMIPRLDRWLRDGLWKQRHEAPKPAATTARTAGNVDALQRFVDRGRQ